VSDLTGARCKRGPRSPIPPTIWVPLVPLYAIMVFHACLGAVAASGLFGLWCPVWAVFFLCVLLCPVWAVVFSLSRPNRFMQSSSINTAGQGWRIAKSEMRIIVMAAKYQMSYSACQIGPIVSCVVWQAGDWRSSASTLSRIGSSSALSWQPQGGKCLVKVAPSINGIGSCV
jgi:hypothetical protein